MKNSGEVTVALSVRQPWAWLITHGFKPIENRTWNTKFRGRILIHAGKIFGPEEAKNVEFVEKKFGIKLPPAEILELGGIVGSVEITDVVQESKSPWFIPGSYGFVLKHPAVCEFQPVVGRQGFFNVRGGKTFTAKEVAV